MNIHPKVKEKMRRQIFAIKKLNPKIDISDIPSVIIDLFEMESVAFEKVLESVVDEMKQNGEIQ